MSYKLVEVADISELIRHSVVTKLGLRPAGEQN